jgi:hypothetical protein
MGLKLVPTWLFAKDGGEEDEEVGLHWVTNYQATSTQRKVFSSSPGKLRLECALTRPWIVFKTSKQFDIDSKYLHVPSLVKEPQQSVTLSCHNWL